MNVFIRHPVDNPRITQPWAANRTGGVTANPNGTPVQQLVFNYGNYQPEGHDGIDYGCPVGTPVYAPGDAVVDYAGWGENMPQWVALKYGFIYGPGGWPSGIVTCLDHGIIGSYMAHKSESYMDARVGQRIKGGTLVGLSGNTGRSGGPHVHFSAIKFPVNYSSPLYSRVNPLDYFSTVTLTPITPGAAGGAATTPIEEIDMTAEQNILARLEQIVGWQDRRINELAAFTRDVVINRGNLTDTEIEAKLKALQGTKPSGISLYKSAAEDAPDIYVYDEGAGFRHIGKPEYDALVSAGATIVELPNGLIDATPKAA